MDFFNDEARRTEWNVKSQYQFFKRLDVFFPQLTESDVEEIEERLVEGDIGYFEVPHYERGDEENPCLILVLNEDRTYIDFLHEERAKEKMDTIKRLVDDIAKLLDSKPITQEAWMQRLKAIASLDDLDLP